MNIYLLICLGCILAAVFLAVRTRYYMQETIYLFRNVGYIAGIVMLAVMALSSFYDFLKTPVSDNPLGDALLFMELFPPRFARFTIWAFVVMCILMAISNISLMKHEGMRPKNMVGTLMQLAFILGTLGIYIITVIMDRYAPSSEGTILVLLYWFVPLYFYIIMDYCECMCISIIIMGWIAARQKPAYDKDFIIIPGCSISKTGGLKPLLKGRTNRAIRYAWDQEIACGKRVLYVPSGGQGPDEIMSEGSAMAFYLMSHSAEMDEVFPEKESKNTYENFLFSRNIIRSMKPDAKVAFATTNYHVLRCGMLAHRVGMDAEGIASSTKWYFWPNGFAREVVAIFAMTKKNHIRMAGVLAVIWGVIVLAANYFCI